VLDARAGLRGVVVRLGERRALLLTLLAHGAAIGAVVTVAPARIAPASLVAASLMMATGLACSCASTRWARQRGWELSALGLAVAALSVALATVEGVG
jgi:4-hydroxybenzoate polyprenyltransferase